MDTQNRAARKKYHVIYKTTCLINEHYYIGMHSTDNLDDGYLGSGKKLWQSLKRHGKENHKCEILEHCSSREAVRKREAELVNYELLFEEKCMNLTLGGSGDLSHIHDNPDNWAKNQKVIAPLGGAAMKKKFENEEFKKAWGLRSTSNNLASYAKGRIPVGWSKGAAAKSALPEYREKQKAALAAISHQQGSANSNYGKKWIHNETKSISVSKELIQQYLDRGYKPGRKIYR